MPNADPSLSIRPRDKAAWMTSMDRRMAVIRYILFAAFGVIVLRLYLIQVIEAPDYARAARAVAWREVTVSPRRGTIYDRHGTVLARDTRVYSVAVRQSKLVDPENTPRLLAQALDLPEAWVRQRIQQNPPFVYVRRLVDPDKVPAVKVVAAEDPGVVLEEELGRTYPRGSLAGALLGFVGIDRNGLAGFEAKNNAMLSGLPGKVRADVDVNQRPIPYRRLTITQSTDGADVFLTIDAGIQKTCEQFLQEAVAHATARMGVAVVLEAKTGEILAAASAPPFDPNKPDEVESQWRESPLVRWAYEPGSTLKGLVVAAALDCGAVGDDDRFYCPGSRQIAGHTIHCAHAPRGGHGWLRPADILRVSCNVGATQIGAKLQSKRLLQYVKGFGFLAPTNVELFEATGSVPSYRGPTWAATASFGQGITMTPLQLAVAYAALANDGLLLKPRLVAAVSPSDGAGLQRTQCVPVGQVLSPEVARKVRQWLVGVIEAADGTGRAARVPGYSVAGKTGTAQKAEGGHYVNKYTASFVGLVPADSPEYVILVIIDEPKVGGYYGGGVAAPVFRKIAEKILAQYPPRRQPPAQPLPEEKSNEPSIPAVRGSIW